MGHLGLPPASPCLERLRGRPKAGAPGNSLARGSGDRPVWERLYPKCPPGETLSRRGPTARRPLYQFNLVLNTPDSFGVRSSDELWFPRGTREHLLKGGSDACPWESGGRGVSGTCFSLVPQMLLLLSKSDKHRLEEGK